jgi:hypothetical protein
LLQNNQGETGVASKSHHAGGKSVRRWFDWIMTRRAKSLVKRMRDWIPRASCIADVGAGTGHNAREYRQQLDATVDEFDVTDLHWIGSGPVLFDGRLLPVSDSSYSVVTLLFVLHYTVCPIELLNELRRMSASRIIVVQSTYRGHWGHTCLRLREFFWGPVAFHLARMFGIIRGQSCPLISVKHYTRIELQRLFQQAGLTIRHCEPQEWRGLQISRDLYVLEPTGAPMTSL